MKRILMTLLCLVGLTGLADMYEFDKTKFAFAEGFNGGTLVQDKLLLQITSGDQLAYFKQGDKRPDGHVIGAGEEGFYAGFTMGWNYTTTAYVTPDRAWFTLRTSDFIGEVTCSGEDVQNGRIPGLSIATKTALTTYVTSFTYWAKIDPTKLVQDQVYTLPLTVWSSRHKILGIDQPYWAEATFTIQVLVGKEFVLKTPDGEQVFPAVTKLFEMRRPNHVAQYENEIFCGGIQQAYEQAIQMAEARAKVEQQDNPDAKAVVDCYITMVSDGTLNPDKITSPKGGTIIINLNGFHLSLEHSLPNAGCVYEFRDAQGTGSVDCKEEFILATDTESSTWSRLIIRGGSYKNDLARPDKFGPGFVRIYGGTFYGGATMGNLKEGYELKIPCWGVDGFKVEFNGPCGVVTSHVHHWMRMDDAEAAGMMGALYDSKTMAVFTCLDPDCPVCKQPFVVSFCQEGGEDFFAHTYPCNVRHFNGQETRFAIVEQKQLREFLLGLKPEKNFFSPELAGAYGAEVWSWEAVYADVPVEDLGDAYANLAKSVKEYCTQAAEVCKKHKIDAFDAIQKLQGEIGKLEFERSRIKVAPDDDPDKDERMKQIKEQLEQLRKEMEQPKRELCETGIFKIFASGVLNPHKDGVNQAKTILNESRFGSMITVENAHIYNTGKYDLLGSLYLENTESAEPSEFKYDFRDAFEVLPIRMYGLTFTDTPINLHAVFDNNCLEEPYTGTRIKKIVSAFTFEVDGEMTLDGVNKPYYFKPFLGVDWSSQDEDIEDAYARHGFVVGSGDSGKNPGTYYPDFEADHEERIDRANRGESASIGSDWSDPFYASSTGYFEFAPWTILDGPVMVMGNDHDEAPYMSLQEAAADLEDEDVTARITQDLFNDGRAENVVVPEKYGFLDLGTCGTFTLDLCGHMIGAEAEPGAFTCIVNDGTMIIVDSKMVGAAKLDEKQVVLLNKEILPGTVYGQVVNNGTMTIGAEPMHLKAGSLGRRFMPSPIFTDLVLNNDTMTIYNGTFRGGLWNVEGTVEVRGGDFEGPIVDDAEGVIVYGGMFNKNYVTFEELEARVAPGYQVVDDGKDYLMVVPHKHVYELEHNWSGFTLTCTNDPICLVRKGAFMLKDPEAVNKIYDREPLDVAPYVCTITDDVTGEEKTVAFDEFVAAFEGVLTVSKPFEYLYLKEPVESAVNAGNYDCGISFIASNVFISAKGAVADECRFGCMGTYTVSPRPLESFEVVDSDFEYTGYSQIVVIDVDTVCGKDEFPLVNDESEWTIRRDEFSVTEAVGSPFSDSVYHIVIDAVAPNFIGAVTNDWRILAPRGTFAEKAADEALMGNAPCGYVDGNPEEGFSLFVTDPQNLVYEAATRTWLTGLTVAWPYKTALIPANREYTPAEDAYFLCSTDPTNLLTAADIQSGLAPAGTRMDVVTGKDGISDVPGVKQFTWWVEISADDAKKAKTAYETVQAEAGAYDNLKQNGEAIAQQLVNAQTICAFIAEGLEKETLVLLERGDLATAAAKINMVREAVYADRLFAPAEVTPEVISNHMAIVSAFAEYIATGDEALYEATMKKWAEVFGSNAWWPTDQKLVQEIMNNWAKLPPFKDIVAGGEIKLPEGIGYNGGIMPVCARNLYIVKNFDHVTYTLTAWGLAGAHDEDGVKATDFKVVIPSGEFVLVEDDLENAEVTLEGGEGFIAEKAAYKFDRKEHFVTVPEYIQLGVNWLQKDVDFTVTGENVKQTGSDAEDCFYTVTLKAIDGRGITGEKTLQWVIVAPSGSFGAATIANGATGEFTANYELTFGDYSLDNNGLVYYTDEEAKAAGLSGEGWYAAMKVVVPVDGVDFMKPSILYFTANGSGFTANDCKDAINEHGVTSEVTEDISTWWYPCVRSFTWWTKVTVDAVKAAEDAGNTAITNTISAYGLAWEGSSDLIDLGSAGIRQQEFKVVIDIGKIELIDADDIQHWPQYNHNYTYELTDGTNLTATCMIDPCRQSPLTLTLVGPADKVYDGTASVATLEGDKAFLFYTGSKHGPIKYSDNEAAPVNAGTYTAKLGVECAKFGGETETKTLEYTFKIAAQAAEPGEITAVLNKDTFNYTGSEQIPMVTVAYKGKILTPGVCFDYTLSGDLSGVGSGAEDTVYTITVSNAVNYAFEPITLNWTVKAPTGSFTDVAKASDAIGGELDDGTLSFEPVDEKGAEVFNSGLVYFTAEEALAANAGDTAGWYAGLTVKLPVSTWTFTTPEHLLFTYYGEQILGSACPYQTEDGLRLTLDTGVTAGGIGNYTYVNSFTWWERIDLEEIEAAREPFIHYSEVATNLNELAKAMTYLGAVALPKSAGWCVTHGQEQEAKEYYNKIMAACGLPQFGGVLTAQQVTDLCELLTGYAGYLATEDEAWYESYTNFLGAQGMPICDPQDFFQFLPDLAATEGAFPNKEDGGLVDPLVTKFDKTKLDKDCTTILMADTCLSVAEEMELNVITRSLTAAATTWSGKVIGIDVYGDKNGIAERTFQMEVDVNELSTFWDNEGHRFYPSHDHEYEFTLGEKGSCLTVTCQKPSDCSYPQMKMWLRNESDTYTAEYNGQPFELFLVTSNTSDQVWREISYESFMDYTGAWLGEKDTYYVGVRGTDYPKTLEAPTAVGEYYAQAAVVHWKDVEQTATHTNLLTRMFKIVAKPIQDCTVALSDTSFQWDGQLHSVGIRGVYNGALELAEGVDYEIDRENSVFEAVGEKGEDRAYPVIIKAIEPNYTGVSTNWWTITTVDFADVEVVTDPDLEASHEFTYTGGDITIGVAAYLDGVELVEGEDYTVEGVVSTNLIGTYTFKVAPNGCRFTGDPKTFTWSIVEPDGEFAADALSAAVADGAPAYAEVVEGTNLVITASTNLWYDAEHKCWFAGFEIKWPYDTEQILRAPTYTDPEHAMVEFSTTNGVFSIADFVEGKVEVAGFDAAADSFYRIKHGRDETYVTGVEWIVPFTFEAVTNALEQGEEELSYEISVMSPAWENNPSGLKRTTYKITLPLDENLVLWDEMGRQVYPVHAHEWTCELFADDGAVTNRLTATCGAADCPQGSVTVALGSEAGTDKEYDGQPLAATFVGAEEFAVHTGAKFGSVNYETEDGIAVNGVPVDAGVYFAKATVTMPDEAAYTLKLRLVIGARNLRTGYIELKGGSEYDYTGREIDVDEDAMTVHYLGQTLVRDKDYTVDAESVFAATGSGVSNTTYKITVEGLGNYTNTLSFYWTIYAPEGDFGSTEKASDELGGEFADETTLVFDDAGEVNYGLKYYTADNAPDGSGIAGWYAGIKVTVPHDTWNFLRPEDMFFRDVDLDESFSGESCPYDGVSLTAGQAIYKYVTAFTWWTRITAEDVTAAEGEDIVRTLKATGLAWSDALKAVGSEGLTETAYQIVVKTEGLVLFDDRGVQIYPHHDHIWSYEIGENAIRATCSVEECPVVACELNFPSVVHEQALGTTAADDTELLGAASFRLHVGAEFGEFRFFDLAGEEIAAPSLVGEYLAAVDVMLPCEDGSVLSNTLETTVSVVKTEGRDFEKGALEPYDFKDGNAGGYGTVTDRTSVVVTDSTKFYYDPSNATWYAGVFVKLPNNIGNYSTDKDVFLSVSTAEGVHYADKVAAGEALTNECIEVKDATAVCTFTSAIGWAIPLTLTDVQAAHEAGETEIVRSITIGANSREATVSPLDLGDASGVKATTFNLVIPLAGLVLVDENGDEVWPVALKVEPSGTVTYPKAVKGSEFLKEKVSATWKAKAHLGSVFGHWEWVGTNGPAPAAFLALSENERKKTPLAIKVAAGEQVRPTDFAAVWYRIDEDTFGQVTLTPSNLVTESKSYVTASVSGLPSGMKFTAKSLTITGAPKKAQTKTVNISLKNASGYTFKQSYQLTVNPDLTVALTPAEDQTKTGAAVLTWCDTTLGKATGSKVYTAGKKASIKATPAKGSIFLGWYEDIMLTKPATWLPKGYLVASQSVDVPAEGLELFARYVKLETWTVGTFDGVYLVPDPVAEISAPEGKVTITVSSAGKVSGKTTFGGKSYSFKATAFDDYLVEDGVGCFTAHVIENTLKRALTIRVWCDEKTGLGNAKIDYGTLEGAPWATAVQNGWKLKVLPKFPTGKSALAPLEADGLKFKFNANGAVAVSGKLAGTAVSAAQASQLLPSEIAVPDMDGASVTMYANFCVYVAPNKTKLPAGFCKIYPVKLTYRNGVFESVSFDVEEE